MIKGQRIKDRAARLLIAFALTCGYGRLQAQDTLRAFRDFITVGNAYKQAPFYISMEIKNSTNLPTEADDTLAVRGEFYVKQEGAYARFGEFEQVIGDSMALLVSDKLQQMILYRDAAPVISRMKNMMGMRVEDSSLARLAQRYTATAGRLSGDTAAIVLQSRERVHGSTLAKETIEMRYAFSTRLLLQVLTVKRTLVPVDSLQYTELTGRAALAGNLLAPETGRYFVIKENRQAFVYTAIEPGSQRKLPVLITDRILRTAEGTYGPVKAYEAYRLTLN